MKTFNVIGTARLNNQLRLRWANNPQRLSSLKSEGHSDITLIELLNISLTKLDSVRYMKQHHMFNTPEHHKLFDDYIKSHEA
jgi:hypothetical protein